MRQFRNFSGLFGRIVSTQTTFTLDKEREAKTNVTYISSGHWYSNLVNSALQGSCSTWQCLEC